VRPRAEHVVVVNNNNNCTFFSQTEPEVGTCRSPNQAERRRTAQGDNCNNDNDDDDDSKAVVDMRLCHRPAAAAAGESV